MKHVLLAADAIFVGHAHFDHMSDAAVVAQDTKAKLIGDPIANELPGTRFIAPLYRSPICAMTSGPKRGEAQFIP